MALTITHSTVATAADDPSAEINKAEWNDDHVLTGDYLRKATVTLSSANILALHTTPITLVAAPGAGKYLFPHRSVAYLDYGTVAYTTGGNGLAVAYAADTGDPLSFYDITASADRVTPAADASAVPAATAVNSALVATSNAAFADGDSPVTIVCWYSVEDVPA